MQRREQTRSGYTMDEPHHDSGRPVLISTKDEAALLRARFDEESAKLNPAEERALAEEGLAADLAEWPEY